jgi:hypothetical protein
VQDFWGLDRAVRVCINAEKIPDGFKRGIAGYD